MEGTTLYGIHIISPARGITIKRSIHRELETVLRNDTWDPLLTLAFTGSMVSVLHIDRQICQNNLHYCLRLSSFRTKKARVFDEEAKEEN